MGRQNSSEPRTSPALRDDRRAVLAVAVRGEAAHAPVEVDGGVDACLHSGVAVVEADLRRPLDAPRRGGWWDGITV